MIGFPSGVLLYWGLFPWFYYFDDIIWLFLLWAGSAFVWFACMAPRLPVLLYHRLPVSRIMRDWRQWAGVASIVVATTTLIATRTPLRIGFLTALPGLTDLVNTTEPGQYLVLSPPKECGLYIIGSTGSRFGYGSHIPGCVVFELANDRESAFIYSPAGAESFALNWGIKGHLMGDWHWMKED